MNEQIWSQGSNDFLFVQLHQLLGGLRQLWHIIDPAVIDGQQGAGLPHWVESPGSVQSALHSSVCPQTRGMI